MGEFGDGDELDWLEIKDFALWRDNLGWVDIFEPIMRKVIEQEF